MSRPETDQLQEVTVRRFGKDADELAVFEFQGKLRELMVADLRENFLATGEYIPGSRAISSQGAMSLAAAGAAATTTALSAALSPTFFMATANPATLMTLGSGVGSAVMGTSGIVGQAAFIPVASSLPVVAPILAMQALNTAMMMQQFKQVDRKLDTIKRTLDSAIARIEATRVGELFTASRVVDDIYAQYERSGQFSQDMLIRLALAERDIRVLASRFRQLVEARNAADIDELDENRQANYDVHSAMLASFLELRVAHLRVCVDMQENPKSVESSSQQLKETLDDGIAFWEQLQDRSRALKGEIEELEETLKGMNWAARNMPGGEGAALEKELVKRKAAYTLTMESERDIMSEFHSLISSAKAARKDFETPGPVGKDKWPTIVYWQDEAGEHSFVTERDLISG